MTSAGLSEKRPCQVVSSRLSSAALAVEPPDTAVARSGEPSSGTSGSKRSESKQTDPLPPSPLARVNSSLALCASSISGDGPHALDTCRFLYRTGVQSFGKT